MVNRYSHAIVLSYYESRGWITLPPAFQSPFVSLPHYTPPPPPPPPPPLPPPQPSPHPHGNEPISSIRYHRPAPFNRRGRQQGPVADASTPRSTTPPPRAQAPTASIPSTTTTRASLKPTRPGRSPQRPTPSIITEIFDPDRAFVSAAATPARQYAQSPPGSHESPHQRISTLTNYDCPSPTSTIFNLLGPLSSSQDDCDDLDYTPPLTNSGSSVSSSSHLEPATPSFFESPIDSHDSPILKPFDDFVPAFDDFSQYATETGSPWHDPASPTAPTIFRLPPVDLSIHPALRGHPPPPPPPMEEEYEEDDAIPPPIARHRRTGPAKLTKVDRSAMSFLKQQPAGDPLSSSKRQGGEYYYAIGNSEPPAIPLNVASMRQAPPRNSKGRQDYQMGTAVAAAGPGAVEQLPVRGNHNALSDWLKGNRSKR